MIARNASTSIADAHSDAAIAAPRYEALDGLRAVAALAVIAFHYTSRFVEPRFSQTLYPFGDQLDVWSGQQYLGSFGVFLFFVISGFVIFRSLEGASGILDFFGRRFARLWPSMLICATITTAVIAVSHYPDRFEATAYWHVTPLEYGLSIFFIDPALFNDAVSGGNLRWVDGVYWTLWVEVRFYALVALVFWLAPAKHVFAVWAVVQAASTTLGLYIASEGASGLSTLLILVLQPGLLCWFTLGMVGLRMMQGALSPAVALAGIFAGVNLLGSIAVEADTIVPLAAVAKLTLIAAVLVPFALFLCHSSLLRPLTHPLLLRIGLASYTLYLLHQIVGIIAMQTLADLGIPALLTMPLVTLMIIVIAIGITEVCDRPLRTAILRWWQPVAHRTQAAVPGLRFGR